MSWFKVILSRASDEPGSSDMARCLPGVGVGGHSMSKKVAKGESLVWVWNGARTPTRKAAIRSWPPVLAGEGKAG